MIGVIAAEHGDGQRSCGAGVRIGQGQGEGHRITRIGLVDLGAAHNGSEKPAIQVVVSGRLLPVALIFFIMQAVLMGARISAAVRCGTDRGHAFGLGAVGTDQPVDIVFGVLGRGAVHRGTVKINVVVHGIQPVVGVVIMDINRHRISQMIKGHRT